MQVTWLWAAPYPRPAHQQNDEGFVSVGAEMVLHTSCVARSNAPLRMAASLWITFGRRRVRPFTPIPAIRRPNSGLVVGGCRQRTGVGMLDRAICRFIALEFLRTSSRVSCARRTGKGLGTGKCQGGGLGSRTLSPPSFARVSVLRHLESCPETLPLRIKPLIRVKFLIRVSAFLIRDKFPIRDKFLIRVSAFRIRAKFRIRIRIVVRIRTVPIRTGTILIRI